MSSNSNDLGKRLHGEATSGSVPESRTDSPGGFTSIFAALGDSVPVTKPAGAEDDDFARLFLSETPAPVNPAADAPQAPATHTTSPQAAFAQPQPPAFAPQANTTFLGAAERQGGTDGDATLIFEALPKAIAPSANMPSLHAPAAQEGPRTAWTSGTGTSEVFAEPARAEHTQTFGPVTPEGTPVVHRTAAPQANPESAVRASEFTQVFAPLAPPAKPLPPLETLTASSAAGGGEFTQFFSAISAREPSAQVGPPAPPLSPNHSTSPTSTPPRHAIPPLGMADRTPVPPEAAVEPPRPSTGDSAPGFQGGGAAYPAGAALPQTMAEVPLRPAQSTGSAPSFTQVFQQIQPPSQAMQQPVRPVVGVTPPAPAVSDSQSSGELRQGSGWPAFGAPTQVHGSFTDVFAAQPGFAKSAPRPAAASPASSAPGDGFTSLFQAPMQSPGSTGSPFDAFVGSPAASHNAGAAPMAGSWPASPASAQAEPLVAGGGDFTKLMQSLASPAQGQSSSAAAGPFGGSDSFFAAPAASNPSGGESEYTRVLRGSSQRDSASPPPHQAPVANNGPTPGMALDSPKPVNAEKRPEAKKPKLLVVLLVLMNVLLVIALIAIGIIVLKRH